jgi:acetaldehyde dehydrogenase (acetylating)
VPDDTRLLLAPLDGVGRDYPLSIEKLCPVLSFYVVKDWREGCERCKQILRYGGMGHTMAIHSRNEQVILEFGLKKPAFRICVNTPTTHGSIGLTTGLDPAMTLGCGGYGGNITSDNISPKHLLNIKRLAYEITPAVSRFAGASQAATAGTVRPASAGISTKALTRQVDDFLGARGYRTERSASAQPAVPPAAPPSPTPPPLDFVCEDDVREALRAGRKLVVSERAIVTPSARELAEEHKIFAPPRG